MKKILFCLLVICSLLLVLVGCDGYSEFDDSYTIWDIPDGGATLSDGTNTFTKYGELPLGMRLENGCFAYNNPAVLDGELYSVYAGSQKSSIRYIYEYTYGITAYVSNDEDKARLDSFLSGDAATVRVIDYGMYDYFLADMELVNKLDALNTKKINVAVRKLMTATCYDIVFFDSEDVLAYTHGAIYEYEGELYYINYDKLGNNYFDSYGSFSFGRGTVDMYKLSDEINDILSEKLENMDDYYDFYTWEDDVVLDEDEMTPAEAIVAIVLIVTVLGILLPLVPLAIGIIVLIKKKGKVESSTYVLIGALALWVIAGILLLILSL